MAAIASVTFTSAGTATLGAAAFTFSMQQAAAAEQIDTTASSNTETAVTVDASGDKKASEDEESEEVEAEEELLEPDSAPAVSVGFNGVIGNSTSFDSQGGAENVGNLDNAPQQQAGAQSVSPSASLPSDDLGFTTNSYAGSIAEALADVESPSVPAAIAAELELATPAKPTSSESSSSSNGNDAPLASGSFAPMGTSSWFGSSASNSFAPVSQGLSSSNLPLTLLGDASPQNLVWDNYSGNGNWSGSENWQLSGQTGTHVTFAEGDNVTFNNGTTTTTLTEDTTAGAMTVTNEANVTVEGDYGLTLNSLSVTGSSVSFAGHVTVNGGATPITPTATASVAFHDGLTFHGTGGKNLYALIINSGVTGTLGGETNVHTNRIAVGSGASLVLEDGANVTAKGVYYSSDLTKNGSITLEGNAKLTTVDEGVYTTGLTMGSGSAVTLGGGTSQMQRVTGASGTINVTGGDLTITGKDNAIGTLNIASGKTVNLNGNNGSGAIATIGSLSGDGNISISSQSGNRNYYLTGDISRWQGKLSQTSGSGSMFLDISGTSALNGNIENTASQANCTLTLNLKGDMDVNGTIDYTNNGPVIVNVSNSGTDVTFTNSVKTSALGIANANSTATFEGNATIGSLSGAGALVVNGTDNTVTLNGASDYSGDITVGSGTLDLTTRVTAGSLSVSDGATLKLAGAEYLTTGTLTLGSGSILDLTSIGYSENPVLLATATTNIINDGAIAQVTGNYKGVLSVEDNQLMLTFVESRDLVWDDSRGNGNWVGYENWHPEGLEDKHVLFNNGANVTIDKVGFIFMNEDAQAGTMTVSSPALVITNPLMGDHHKLSVQNLEIKADSELTAIANVEVTETVNLADGATWNITSEEDTTISADIISSEETTGEGIAISKAGDSILTLSGDNSGYQGALNVQEGTLAARSTTALGSADVIVDAGAKLSLESRSKETTAGSLTLAGDSTIAFEGNTTLNLETLTLCSDSITWDLTNYGFSGDGTATLIEGIRDMEGATYLSSIMSIEKPDYITSASLSYDQRGEYGAVILTFVKPQQPNLIWKGGPGTWDYVSEDWIRDNGDGTFSPNQKFVNNSNVSFIVSGMSELQVVEPDITAGDVLVGNDVKLNLTADGGALLTAGDITVYGDVTVTDVAIKAVTLFVDENATVTAVVTQPSTAHIGALTPDLSGTGTIIKQGEGALALSGDNTDFEGTFVIEEGTLIVDETSEDRHSMGANPKVVLAGDAAVLAGEFTATGDVHITSTANATVSAKINAPGTATLTFDIAENKTVTASNTLSGNIYKDGEGTLRLTGDNSDAQGELFINQGRVEATDDTQSLGDGIIHVNSGGILALTDTNGNYHIAYLYLGYGGTVVLPGVATSPDGIQLHIDTDIILQSNSSVTLNPTTKADLEEFVKSIKPGERKLFYLADYHDAHLAEEGSLVNDEDPSKFPLLQFVYLQGLDKTSIRSDYFITLRVDPDNNRLLGQIEGPRNGVYWDPSSTPAEDGKRYWDTTSSNWKSNYALTGDSTKYSDNVNPGQSVYFMEDVEQTVWVNLSHVREGKVEETIKNRDLVIGAGTYTFKSTSQYSHLLDPFSTRQNNFIVGSGATAIFDRIGIELSENSFMHVYQDGTFKLNDGVFGVYSLQNEGNIEILANPEAENLLGHVLNTATMNVVWKDGHDDWTKVGGIGDVWVGDVVNLGSMTLGGPTFVANSVYGQGIFRNDGDLTFDADCPLVDYTQINPEVIDNPESQLAPTEEVRVYVPVEGLGSLSTTGKKTVRFTSIHQGSALADASTGTVSQDSLDLGAGTSIFEEAVEITETTVVRAKKKAIFYGGDTIGTTPEAEPGSLGVVALEAGVKDEETSLTLGGYYHGEYDYDLFKYVETVHDSTYTVGPVTAGEYTVFTVEDGALATIESYNAGGETVGTIVVGAETSQESQMFPPTSLDYADAYLTVSGKTNVAELNVQNNGTADLKGAANVDHLTQSGGSVIFNADSYLYSGNVSGGQMNIKPGTVLTLGSVIIETGDYEVKNNDGTGTPGYIDASELELVTDTETMTYSEVLYDEGLDITVNQSGFAASGRQYVQVFDVQDGGYLTANDTVIYHEKAAGLMTLISGDDPSTETYGPEGNNWAGYGYLNIQEKQYMSYYVRDNYVYGDLDGRTDNHIEPKKDPHPQVKLSDIVEAATTQGGELLLENVVFDQTDYNKNLQAGKFNGTLTVDKNMTKTEDAAYTEAGLFTVTDGTRAAIDIVSGVEVLADENYQGVAGTLNLSGGGVYEINDRGDLGENVSLLADDTDGVDHWTGTVRLTGTAEDVNMPDLSVNEGGAASTIEFSHWSGTFREGGQTSNGKIVLVGSGLTPSDAAAISFEATDPETSTDLTWTNSVTGTGARMRHEQPGDLKLTMTGDTSKWDGVFYQGAANTTVDLTFNLAEDQSVTDKTQNTDVWATDGVLNVTYGGELEQVTGDVVVYGENAAMTLAYTGDEMEVSSSIWQGGGQGELHLVVGDGKEKSKTTFSGVFSETDGADMTVEAGSTAIIDTNAPLLWVRGEEGSTVVVNENKTLSLTSENPETGFSEFHGLTNNGSIQMEANGGSIHLVVDNGVTDPTYKVGDLDLVGDAGTAVIQTAANGQTVKVEITDLSGPNSANQVLQLKNSDTSGTVNYNLGGDTHFTGTVEFGSNGSASNTNVVLNSDGVAANAVLKSIGTSEGTADVVVNTPDAKVLGIDSAAGATVGGTLYGTKDESTDPNRQVTITGDGTYSYNGGLGENLDIAYTGSGKQTFEGGATGFNGAVTVDNGDKTTTTQGVLEILNASEVKVTELLLGENDLLRVQNGGANGSTVVSASVVAEGGPTQDNQPSNASKLHGNLTLASGSTYDVSAAGGLGGLDLAGSFTINKGATLSQGDIDNLIGFDIGSRYDLAFGVVDVNFNVGDEAVTVDDKVDASQYFTNLGKDEYYICYSGVGISGGNGSNVGTVYLYKVAPEPTTSTLSLLALAALAARRRRKG